MLGNSIFLILKYKKNAVIYILYENSGDYGKVEGLGGEATDEIKGKDIGMPLEDGVGSGMEREEKGFD